VQFTGLCVYADTAILTRKRRSGITGLAEPREPAKDLGNEIQENQIKRSKSSGEEDPSAGFVRVGSARWCLT